MANDKAKSPSFDGFTQADWDEVSDNPEITAEEWGQAKPFAEVFPELAAKLNAHRPGKVPAKKLISLRLDQDVIDAFRATGPGWQSRINATLREKLPIAGR